ncbi:MAG: holo-ACP synthase [Limnochordaceae bacterium]|uniref:Holo-[acyl-carrier-protein] synthase n=1 Tax=Carboxydichorda subterranea TaxID=3109565 RepID=A0ABZ1BUX3_9FIRM|nr:holo-ACP synthase [Limnochorda sp. L945t]MBE3597334.1 holo-ACP synthase [Limnochordaceae bacterium]WRP16383.1 holo-ACP synthase [Limnochorda sp. L945t]
MGCGPGPSAIVGVGVDVVEVDRIARALERHGERFLERLFSSEEIAYCLAKRHPAARAACLAARFAAKEAVMKVLGTGRRGVAFHEIAVTHRRGGRPAIELRGRAARVAEALGVDEVCVSVSHGRDVAVVVALGVRR